ncbi:MAG: F0F1 ATP synthase subunit alpha, partial [Planctomycetaceae bacterium]|nr:F0F1 ATP synthase subunit alpha [Planctomycetaceae bacterium]
RGYRMVELLKQPQFQPLHFADQVISIFAGGKGYFDKVPVNRVQEAEKMLLQFVREEKSEVRDALIQTGTLDAETEKALVSALEEFVKRWEAQSSR